MKFETAEGPQSSVQTLMSNKKQTPASKIKVLEQSEPVEIPLDIHVKEEPATTTKNTQKKVLNSSNGQKTQPII